jgi:hypothetical protein
MNTNFQTQQTLISDPLLPEILIVGFPVTEYIGYVVKFIMLEDTLNIGSIELKATTLYE